MTIGSNDISDPMRAVIHRGRMALEALQSREQAALFHAARVDLQVALSEAEAGNDVLLQRWLQQYRSLVEQEPELQRHFASVQGTIDFIGETVKVNGEQSLTDFAATPKLKTQSRGGNLLSQSIEMPAASGADLITDDSPWPAMIDGANQRAAAHRKSTYSSNSLSDLQATFDASSRMDGIAIALDQPENQESWNSFELDTELGTGTDDDVPLVIPASFIAELNQDNKSDSKKKRAWMSPAVITSAVVHIMLLIGMSTYVIRLARNPEPKAIVASPFESETVSMEVPMEMHSQDEPTLDSTELPMPAQPSFAAAMTASSNSIQLPTSMTGAISSAMASSTENALQQATKTSASHSAGNSIQFFGVKAAGNTFCFVVDGSPSMKKDGAFVAAKAELVRSLSLLKPKQRFYISFFGGQIDRLTLEGREQELYPVYATPENLKKTLLWIDRVRVQERGLPPNNALSEAIKMDPDGIFLLFDGDTRVDVPAYLRKANRSDDLISGGTPLVPIHTIGFYTQEFEALMKRIASENNGTYRFVPKPGKPR